MRAIFSGGTRCTLVVVRRSVGCWGAQALARSSEAFRDDAPANVRLSALRSDYGYVVGPSVATKALEVIGDKVDIHERALRMGEEN